MSLRDAWREDHNALTLKASELLDRAEKAEAALKGERTTTFELRGELEMEQDRNAYLNEELEKAEGAKDAALAELIERGNAAYDEGFRTGYQKAALEAEAETARLSNLLTHAEAIHNQQFARAEKAEAENKRLRVCGTCRHMGDTLCWVQTVGSIYVEPSNSCHLVPSHWKPYWEET